MKSYKAPNLIYHINKKSKVRIWMTICLLIFIIFLFLPWTQNIQSRGYVTTLYQDQRPQQVNTIIGGKVLKWFIKEGDYVKVGDTLVQLGEVKVDYLDPQLLQRTQEQIEGKNRALNYYKNKVEVTDQQIGALNQNTQLKINQIRNKINQLNQKMIADSVENLAAQNDWNIANLQLKRQKTLYDSGLVSLTQLESRNQQFQNALAKKTSSETKWRNSKQDLAIAAIELNSLLMENLEKVSKAQSDQFQSLTQVATGEADIAKLKNLLSSYNIRNGLYFIVAIQSGQIIKAQKAGLGEYVKEGEMIAEIVPDKIQYAVELYVRPLDLPLLKKGQEIRFMFDGFPAIVFSGWPRASSGTFGGIISSIESNVSSNGKFRIIAKENPKDKPWPPELKVGVGAQGIALLKDVPVWYELWRNINGFPPDYYQNKEEEKKQKNKTEK